MNTGVQVQHIGVRRGVAQFWQAACAAFTQLCAAVAEGLLHAGAMRVADSLGDAQRQAATDDERMLRRAVHANSASEVDWLLYAAILTDPAKRRYCLERALALNPNSDLAKQALASAAVMRTA